MVTACGKDRVWNLAETHTPQIADFATQTYMQMIRNQGAENLRRTLAELPTAVGHGRWSDTTTKMGVRPGGNVVTGVGRGGGHQQMTSVSDRGASCAVQG